jgi:hypothetical protein
MLKQNDIVGILEEAKFLYSIPVESDLKIVEIIKNPNKEDVIFVRHLNENSPWGIFEVLPKTIYKKE